MNRHKLLFGCSLWLTATLTAQGQTEFNDYLQSLPGLVSHWGMEETTGTSVADSVTTDLVDGNNPGAFTSGMGASLNVAGPQPSDGFAGFSASNSAIDFVGTAGQRLDMNPAGYTGTEGVVTASLSMWYRITESDTTKHVHLGGLEDEADGASGRYALALNHYPTRTDTTTSQKNGGLRVFARAGNPSGDEVSYSTGYALNSNPTETVYWDNQWHHVVATIDHYPGDERRVRMFIDGKLKKADISGSGSATLSSLDAISLRDALTFGEDAGADDRLMVGQLDEIAMFNRAITPAEIGIAFQAAKGITAVHSLMPTRGISAHRGASDTHPENTIAAINEAVAHGAHQIEIDVQLTSDGQLVLMHDDTIDRTTDGSGRVQDFTVAQLQSLDAGTWKGSEFAGEQIPTFEEALEAIPLNVWVNVDVKSVDGNDVATGNKAAEIVHQMGRTHQAFISGNKDETSGAESYETTAGIDLLTNNMDREDGDTTAYVNYTINNGYDYLQLHHNNTFPSPAEMTALSNAGVEVNYFFSDTPSELGGLYADGVDFVLVDELAEMMGASIDEDIVPVQAIYRGDFNMDGQTDADDFNLLFEAMVDPAGFALANPDFDANIYGDYNMSGTLEVDDYEGYYLEATGGSSVVGDYNLDGTVDAADYAVWKSAFGLASASNLVPADGNGDGMVNLADYTVWRDNLGATATSALFSTIGTNVPEPSSVLLIAAVTVGLLSCHRRRLPNN